MSSPKEALAIYVARRIRAHDVIDLLADVRIERGIAEHIRSDNGPERVAKSLRAWLGRLWVRRPSISSPAVLGRTATARALMASSEMSC